MAENKKNIIKPGLSATEEIRERYKLLYETSNDAIMTIEPPDWKFTAGNPAAVKMFNCKDEKEFTSLGPWDVSPEKQPDGQPSAAKAQKMIMQAMKEGSNFFEWTHKKYKGGNFPATILLSRFKLNGKDVVQATVRDMTEQKQAEINLQEKINELEKMNKMMVSRELRMVELKKQIDDLKNKK